LAVLVLQRDPDDLAGLVAGGPGGAVVLHGQRLVAADERTVRVLDHRAGQQMRLAEDLEAVADAEDGHAAVRGVDHLVHHGGEAADRPGPQVVAVGEAAGQHDRVDLVQRVVAVPQRDRLGAAETHGAQRVAVVERAGEGHHTDAHQASSTSRAATSSITGFDSRVSAASRREASTSSVTSPSTSSSNRLPWRTEAMPSKPRRGSAAATALPCGSRISGFGMTWTTTRGMGALLRGRVARAAACRGLVLGRGPRAPSYRGTRPCRRGAHGGVLPRGRPRGPGTSRPTGTRFEARDPDPREDPMKIRHLVHSCLLVETAGRR